MFSKATKSANKKDLTSDTFQMQQQCGRETGININVKHNDQQGVHADMQRLQSPIFNIHIHVPPYQGDNLKMYLPRIQPVIHLHFDELARKLEINREQNEDATYRAFQKLLSMTSPRFGNVKFHYQDKPNETVNRNKDVQCQDKRNETVNRNKEFNRTAPSFSLNYSNDTGAHASANSERPEIGISHNCGMPDCCGSQNSVEDDNNTPDGNVSGSGSNTEEILKQKFNLREAVVLLEDVCKTDYYKNMVAAGHIRDSAVESESECDDEVESTGEQENMSTGIQEYGNCYVKRERESFSPECSSSRAKGISENVNPLNPSNQMLHRFGSSSAAKTVESVQNRLNTGVTESLEKTLSSLAEGCNFSDILSRFRIKKCEESDDDSVKCLDDITQSREMRSNEGCNYNEKVLEHSSYVEPVTMGNSFHGRDNSDRNPSHHCRIQPDFGSRRENFTKTNEPSGSPNKYKEVGPENPAWKPPSNESVIDDMAWTSEEVTSKSRLEMISAVSPTWHKRILMFPGTRENRYVNMGVSGFRLDVFEEDMGRSNTGRTGRNLKKKAVEVESSPSKESAPPKKMKQSDDSNKSRAPSEMGDYIPLQASGSTKFAVAPLNKVSPYKTHDARNFKADMLYGKRINRFTSSDHLRIYQLKQEAAKTQSN